MVLYREFGKLIGGNTSLMLALYLIYPGIISLVQFRQFVACSNACLGLALLCSRLKSRVILYLILVSCAIFVHRTAAVFLFALLGELFLACEKKGRIIIVLVAVVGVGYALANATEIAESLFGELRTSTYISAGNGSLSVGTLGAFRNALLLLLMALCPYLCSKFIACQEGHGELSFWDWNSNSFLKYIAVINICLLVIVPFVFITNDFMRFERHGFTAALAIFSIMPMLTKRHVALSCKAFYLVICIAFAYFYAGVVFDTVYAPILTFRSIPAFFA